MYQPNAKDGLTLLGLRLKVFDRRVLGFTALGVMILAPTNYILAKLILNITALNTAVIHTFGLALVFLFGYEVFFACQRADLGRRLRIVRTRVDDWIPFIVQSVWIYGVLYYPFVFFPVALLPDHRQFLLFVAGGILILLCSMPIYLLWPTRCPSEWRNYPTHHPSARYLQFIQQFDNGRCCIPSLHVAIAAYVATFYPWSAALVIVPGLISLSCLFVKQHSIIDLPPSLLFGFAIGFGVNTIM